MQNEVGPDLGLAGRRCCKPALAEPHLWAEYNLQCIKFCIAEKLISKCYFYINVVNLSPILDNLSVIDTAWERPTSCDA